VDHDEPIWRHSSQPCARGGTGFTAVTCGHVMTTLPRRDNKATSSKVRSSVPSHPRKHPPPLYRRGVEERATYRHRRAFGTAEEEGERFGRAREGPPEATLGDTLIVIGTTVSPDRSLSTQWIGKPGGRDIDVRYRAAAPGSSDACFFDDAAETTLRDCGGGRGREGHRPGGMILWRLCRESR
jgi:hypothetical protein